MLHNQMADHSLILKKALDLRDSILAEDSTLKIKKIRLEQVVLWLRDYMQRIATQNIHKRIVGFECYICKR